MIERLGKITLLLAFLVIAISCDGNLGLDLTSMEGNTGLKPAPWIEGNIYFEGQPTDQTGEVIIVVAPEFPPHEWTDIIKSSPLPFSQDTVEYQLPLNYGTYDIIAILWKPKGEEWSFETISNILGVYTKPNLFRPLEVTIEDQDKFVSNIDIEADFGLIRYGSFIKGEITYKGDFPEDTDMMILASFPMKPERTIDYLFALGWDLTIPIAEKSFHPYRFLLNVSGNSFHKYVALFWKREGGSPYDFKRIAEFEFPDTPNIFGREGTMLLEGDTLNANIVADFSRVNP